MLHVIKMPQIGTFLFLFVCVVLNESTIFNRYHTMRGKPMSSTDVKIERLASFGATYEMQITAANLIRRYFHPHWFITGNDSDKIGDRMERKFGGNFFVGMFSSETGVVYTIVRRSPSYMLFRVANRLILIAKESSNPKLHNDFLL